MTTYNKSLNIKREEKYSPSAPLGRILFLPFGLRNETEDMLKTGMPGTIKPVCDKWPLSGQASGLFLYVQPARVVPFMPRGEDGRGQAPRGCVA
jgi:hypothetical protein